MSDSKLTPANLSALMCARICHDLVSPIGALGTALEVLDDDANTEMHADAMDLVKTSARQASAKLQFLRLAFGAGGSAPGIISVAELVKLVDGMYGEGKAEISWDASLAELPKSQARIVLNMIMLALQAIPRGGTLKVSTSKTDGETLLDFNAEGPKARLAEAATRTLSGKAPDDGFDGRTIQPFYTGMMIREIGAKVSAGIDGERVRFAVKIPE